ncbi:hypothetical protein [Richelia intracellularis]|nr:hypothetical protein [Richelia intracellularis]
MSSIKFDSLVNLTQIFTTMGLMMLWLWVNVFARLSLGGTKKVLWLLQPPLSFYYYCINYKIKVP